MPWIAQIVAYYFEKPHVRIYCFGCVEKFGLDVDTAERAVRADDPPLCEDTCDGCGTKPDLNLPTVFVSWDSLRSNR
jgi:hypothetical protein